MCVCAWPPGRQGGGAANHLAPVHLPDGQREVEPWDSIGRTENPAALFTLDSGLGGSGLILEATYRFLEVSLSDSDGWLPSMCWES